MCLFAYEPTRLWSQPILNKPNKLTDDEEVYIGTILRRKMFQAFIFVALLNEVENHHKSTQMEISAEK